MCMLDCGAGKISAISVAGSILLDFLLVLIFAQSFITYLQICHIRDNFLSLAGDVVSMNP